MPAPSFPLLLVSWTDAAHHGAGTWVDPGDLKDWDPSLPVTTVGYELRRSETHLVLAQTVTSEGDYTGVFSIPLGCVLSERRLR